MTSEKTAVRGGHDVTEDRDNCLCANWWRRCGEESMWVTAGSPRWQTNGQTAEDLAWLRKVWIPGMTPKATGSSDCGAGLWLESIIVGRFRSRSKKTGKIQAREDFEMYVMARKTLTHERATRWHLENSGRNSLGRINGTTRMSGASIESIRRPSSENFIPWKLEGGR